MNWIQDHLILEGKKVRLEPLADSHFDELIMAGQHDIIWPYMPVDGTHAESLRAELEEALIERNYGSQYPLVVIDKTTGKIIGSTRLLKLNPEHKNLEIGWTWYKPEYWGKGYNDECKLLLLTYCFEALKTIRVQIVAAENNSHSRRAIERVGGKLEGIFRNFVIRYNGMRNCAYYSIIDEEWAQVKLSLRENLRQN